MSIFFCGTAGSCFEPLHPSQQESTYGDVMQKPARLKTVFFRCIATCAPEAKRCDHKVLLWLTADAGKLKAF